MSIMTITVMTADEARSLTDRIKAHVAELLPLIKEAFERRADVALGYSNWVDYCDAELTGLRLPINQRREAVAELRQTGMSTRAIGAALGVTEGTVRNDLSTAKDYAVPDRIRGLDGGREQPASRPSTPEPAPVAIEPDRPKPPAWDPDERKAHEEEVTRLRDIEAARRYADSIVTNLRGAVVTIVAGYRYGETGLITPDMIREMRDLVDMLEAEL